MSDYMHTEAKAKLRDYLERIERLEEQKADLQSDIKDIFDDAKGSGYDVKAMKHVLKLRKMEEGERRDFEGAVDTYCHALGMTQGDLFDAMPGTRELRDDIKAGRVSISVSSGKSLNDEIHENLDAWRNSAEARA